MGQAIVIGTTPTPSPWLRNILDSLRGYDKYPVLIVSNYGWELGKIKYIYEQTKISEFLLFQETMEIKNTSFIDQAFEEHKGKTVYFGNKPGSYLVKYCRHILDQIEIPTCTSKRESVEYDSTFNHTVITTDPNTVQMFPNEIMDNQEREEKFGRLNMVLENDYIKKYKGCWSSTMIVNSDRYEETKHEIYA